jgi:hypothetical protein
MSVGVQTRLLTSLAISHSDRYMNEDVGNRDLTLRQIADVDGSCGKVSVPSSRAHVKALPLCKPRT